MISGNIWETLPHMHGIVVQIVQATGLVSVSLASKGFDTCGTCIVFTDSMDRIVADVMNVGILRLEFKNHPGSFSASSIHPDTSRRDQTQLSSPTPGQLWKGRRNRKQYHLAFARQPDRQSF